MMNDLNDKSFLNMPGDELSDTIKRLSRYTLAVEFIAIGACLSVLTKDMFIMLVGATFLMYLGVIFMKLCEERKKKQWVIISIIQLVLATIDLLAIIFSKKIGATVIEIIAYLSIGFLWIHCGMCFFEYRKDEEVPFLRFVGAFIVVITLIVCLIIRQWLVEQHITFF